jgi:putative spermidine/putrescine transport system permease protein
MFQSIDWGLGAAISVTLVVIVGVLMALVFRFLKPAGLVR